MPLPPGERSSEEEGVRGEGGSINEIRTMLAIMEVVGEEMYKV